MKVHNNMKLHDLLALTKESLQELTPEERSLLLRQAKAKAIHIAGSIEGCVFSENSRIIAQLQEHRKVLNDLIQLINSMKK